MSLDRVVSWLVQKSLAMTGKSREVPSYSIRESRRARRVILKVSTNCGLEVVVPQGFDCRSIPDIVEAKRPWIETALGRLEGKGYSREDVTSLPESIHLRAAERRFEVRYRRTQGASLKLAEEDHSVINIEGDLSNIEGCRDLLKMWLRHQGRFHLIPWLERESRETGLHFGRVQIRGQKSRWGSCSSRGTISLNCSLLFLPPDLVRYVLIHELCHTMHLNHSGKFWSLVTKMEPECRVLDAEVNSARKLVPFWAR